MAGMGQAILFTYLLVSCIAAIVQSSLPAYFPGPAEPTTGPPTTTTTPEPIENCHDLTGRWESWNPSSMLCLEAYETGDLIMLMRNGTDLFFYQGTGMTVYNDHRHVGFTMHSPTGLGDVVGMAGECHKCFGTEVIIMSSVSRNRARSSECGISEGIRGVDYQPYVLTRHVQHPGSCRGMELDVYNPNPLLLSKMGIRELSPTRRDVVD